MIGLLEAGANGFTALAIFLAGRNSVHTWWTGIIGCALFALLFFQSNLYADVLLQAFFVVTSVIGWWKWMSGAGGAPLPMSHADFASLLWTVPFGLGATAAYGAVLNFYTNAYAPFIDTTVLVFSVIGQVLLLQRRNENCDVIDSVTNKVIARAPVGQAPQALVYVSNAVPHGDGMANLSTRANSEPINIALKPVAGDAKGFIVSRNLGVVDALEVSLYKLKPQTAYSVYVTGQAAPVASFKTNPMGMANGTAIGPMREVSTTLNAKAVNASRVLVMEGDAPADPQKAVLMSAQ